MPKESTIVDFSLWPEAPKDHRPKTLYISQSLSPDEQLFLEQQGWKPQDVRLLPNKSDDDRIEALKARLEGIRTGSICAAVDVLKHLDLEARIYGLLGAKAGPTEKDKVETASLDELLDFGKTLTKKKRK